MLIIQIALGIVLAVVILCYWRKSINFGINGLLFIVSLSLVVFGGFLIYENSDSVILFLSIPILIFLLVVLFALIDFSNHKLSVFTLYYCNVTIGELIGLLIAIGMVVLELFFIFSTDISNLNYSISLICVFFGFGLSFVQIKNIECNMKLRETFKLNGK